MTTSPKRVFRGTAPAAETRAFATVVKVERADTSYQLESDIANFGVATVGMVLAPTPYNINWLHYLYSISNTLRPCIDAFVTNTVGTGWEIEPLYKSKAMDEGERIELETFQTHANSEQSLQRIMIAVMNDREISGTGYVEIIRDMGGRNAMWKYADARPTRATILDQEAQLISYDVMRGRRVSTIKEWRRFRRYVQRKGAQTVYFKEFGDPRDLNRTSGIFKGRAGYEPGNEATEIMAFKIGEGVYGIPRWVHQIPSVLGSREAEEFNLSYFKDNGIPPLLMMISGGRLTAASHRDITNLLHHDGLGKDRQNRIMMLEAVGAGDSLDQQANVKMEIERLTDSRQNDTLFGDYDERNSAKVRSSWRLPALLVGMGQDTNFANAQVSISVAESQVFGPQRDLDDEQLNHTLVNGRNGLGLSTVKLKGRVPSINSPELTIKAMQAANTMGAITPRLARTMMNKLLQVEMPELPAKGTKDWAEWMDQPIAMTVGAKADTHAEAATKDPATKKLEGDGDVGPQTPEKGSEGEPRL